MVQDYALSRCPGKWVVGTNLRGLQLNVVNSNFGRYQSTRGTRVIQLNFRLTF